MRFNLQLKNRVYIYILAHSDSVSLDTFISCGMHMYGGTVRVLELTIRCYSWNRTLFCFGFVIFFCCCLSFWSPFLFCFYSYFFFCFSCCISLFFVWFVFFCLHFMLFISGPYSLNGLSGILLNSILLCDFFVSSLIRISWIRVIGLRLWFRLN